LAAGLRRGGVAKKNGFSRARRQEVTRPDISQRSLQQNVRWQFLGQLPTRGPIRQNHHVVAPQNLTGIANLKIQNILANGAVVPVARQWRGQHNQGAARAFLIGERRRARPALAAHQQQPNPKPTRSPHTTPHDGIIAQTISPPSRDRGTRPLYALAPWRETFFVLRLRRYVSFAPLALIVPGFVRVSCVG